MQDVELQPEEFHQIPPPSAGDTEEHYRKMTLGLPKGQIMIFDSSYAIFDTNVPREQQTLDVGPLYPDSRSISLAVIKLMHEYGVISLRKGIVYIDGNYLLYVGGGKWHYAPQGYIPAMDYAGRMRCPLTHFNPDYALR